MQHLRGKMNMKSKAGMTLIEVLVAMAVFAVVAIPLFNMFANSIRMEQRAMVESITTYTAQMMIEEAYGRDADDLHLTYNTKTPGNPDPDGKMPYKVRFSSAEDDFIMMYYIWSAEPVGTTGLVRVKVTVGNEDFEVSTSLEVDIAPVAS